MKQEGQKTDKKGGKRKEEQSFMVKREGSFCRWQLI